MRMTYLPKIDASEYLEGPFLVPSPSPSSPIVLFAAGHPLIYCCYSKNCCEIAYIAVAGLIFSIFITITAQLMVFINMISH